MTDYVIDTDKIAEIERDFGTSVVAVVFNEDGAVYDHCFNWETAQNFALSEGMTVKAIANDGSMTIERIQALCDAEKARYDDCFGG